MRKQKLRCKDCRFIIHEEGECYAICGKDEHLINEASMMDVICEYPKVKNKVAQRSKFIDNRWKNWERRELFK